MRVAVFACSLHGAALWEALRRSEHDIVGLFTHVGRPDELGRVPSVEALAERDGAAVVRAPSYTRWDAAAALAALEPDVLLCAGFRSPLTPATIEVPARGAFNLHPSLLPRYRGRSPVNWAVLRGERSTGLTLHVMEEAIDAGDIVAQVEVPIGRDDTSWEVLERLALEIPALVTKALGDIERGTLCCRPQDHAEATYFGGRSAADGRIDWRWPAPRIHDLVRAATHPFPGAWCERRGRRYVVWRTARRDDPSVVPVACPPGSGIHLADGRFGIATAGGVIEVLRWSADGGPERDGGALAAEWGAGSGDTP